MRSPYFRRGPRFIENVRKICNVKINKILVREILIFKNQILKGRWSAAYTCVFLLIIKTFTNTYFFK